MRRIDRQEKAKALMHYDAQYIGIIAGMDEVGRGPLVGDVVTACVVMPREPILTWIDDSKKLSETRREMIFEDIMKHALQIGIGRCSPAEIDAVNILEATRKAMREAAAQVSADIFLIDAVTGLGLKGKEVSIIKGDATSYAIAAASIIAKVTRDREMKLADEIYPEYGFIRNKGYGTAEHIAALRKYGPCPIHRRTFIGKFIS